MREVIVPSTWRRFGRARGGAAALEMALIAPLLLLLLAGIIAYGGYFWTAHSVQQAANDAARAAIAGLNDAERVVLARDAMNDDLASLGLLTAKAELRGAREGQAFAVEVIYDARESAFWAFAALMPMPDHAISRRAVIQVGGY